MLLSVIFELIFMNLRVQTNKSRKYNNLKWKNEQESKEEKTEFWKA